jgi:arylsulfatase A-like enzyme
MTGLDAARTCAVNVSSGRTLLRTDVPTMPELLRKAGYATGLFGKWHLGDNKLYRPNDRGFDEVVSFPSSHIGSVPDYWLNDYFDDTYAHNGVLHKYSGYTTDVFFDEAMRWIGECKGNDKPFFTYIATAAPHQPHYVPQQYRERIESRINSLTDITLPSDDKVRRELISYLSMIENFDDNVGRLEKFLRDEGLSENTIFVYLTDNGSTFGDVYFPCGMRGKKATLWEGGHRVPLMIRWPNGNIGQPRVISELTQVQDLLPTLLELVGKESEREGKQFDGVSLARLLTTGEDKSLVDRKLYINFSRMPLQPFVPTGGTLSDACTVRKEGSAVVWKQWRYLEDRELYDLSVDPLQKVDCADKHPEVVAQLREALDRWWTSIEPIANLPQYIPIDIATDATTLLSACDWWNVFVDQQAQVRRGELKNGVWHIEIVEAGRYEFELRRWPRESDLALNAASPQADLVDGKLEAGHAIDIQGASIEIAGHSATSLAKNDDKQITFAIDVPQGRTTLRTAFLDSQSQELLGAYYVYARKANK